MIIITAKGQDIIRHLWEQQNGKISPQQLRCDYYKCLCPKCKTVTLWMPKSSTEIKQDVLYSKKRCKECSIIKKKRCTRCKETKNICNFETSRGTIDGYNPKCKKCIRHITFYQNKHEEHTRERL